MREGRRGGGSASELVCNGYIYYEITFKLNNYYLTFKLN